MKIGILTFQFGYNYGGILQCYALQQILRENGHDVEVLNYCPYPDVKLSFLHNWKIRSGRYLRQIIVRYFTHRMKQKCDAFKRKYIILTSKCNSINELAALASRYDAIIVGSDQIWNRVFHDGPEYYLGWEPFYQGKRISYAASCGYLDQPAEGRECVSAWLERFDELSVRDQVTFDMIHKLCGRSAIIVADPTLLYNFPSITLVPILEQLSYIFMYILGEEIEGSHSCMIAKIRHRYGNIPVLQVIPTAHKCKTYICADKKIFDAGPDEWMNLLANAAFVYTDSYHAAVFAVKHKKPFLAYYSEKIRSARLIDLANRYQVKNAVISSLEDAEIRQCLENDINYDIIHSHIKKHVQESLTYLANSIATDL